MMVPSVPAAQADINSQNILTLKSHEVEEEDEFVLMNNIGTGTSQISHVSDLVIDEIINYPRQEVLRKFSGMDIPTRN